MARNIGAASGMFNQNQASIMVLDPGGAPHNGRSCVQSK